DALPRRFDRVGIARIEGRLNRVQRAGADVAEDDPEGPECQSRLSCPAPPHSSIFAFQPPKPRLMSTASLRSALPRVGLNGAFRLRGGGWGVLSGRPRPPSGGARHDIATHGDAPPPPATSLPAEGARRGGLGRGAGSRHRAGASSRARRDRAARL